MPTINEITKGCIEEALFSLMHEKKFKDITVTEIVSRAGVARVSFYRNYIDKEDVVVRHLNRMTEKWWKSYILHPEEDVIYSLFNYLYHLRETVEFMYHSDLGHLIRRSFFETCGPEPGDDNQTAYLKAILYGLLSSWCEEWLKRGLKETPEELAQLFSDLYQHKLSLWLKT